MGMQRRAWSLSALAVELRQDRRTLAKRLETLPPAEIKRFKNRTEKRWRLLDVLEHLDKSSQVDQRHLDAFNELMGAQMYPALISSDHFTKILIYGVEEEFGFDRVRSLRVFQLAACALGWAFVEVLQDDEIAFTMPPFVAEMGEIGVEPYVEKHGLKVEQ